MYFYIVDPQNLKQKEFERVQNLLYSSLSEYRIQGEFVRVTSLRTIPQLVENAFAREAKTIVAVGNDETLHDVINAVGKREIVIGYIPITESEIGEMLGIKNLSQAIKTIANRRIQELDLGLVNDYYFLSKINLGLPANIGVRNLFNVPTFEIIFSVDGKYQASQNVIGGLIVNSRGEQSKKAIGDPVDGLLDVLLLPKLTNWNVFWHRQQLLDSQFEEIPQSSVIHVNKIQLQQPTGLPIRIGQKIIAKLPVTINVVEGMLKMIVGKERKF